MFSGTVTVETARYKSITNKMPMLYVCLVALMGTKIGTFAGSMPWVLGIGLPISFSVYALIRFAQMIALQSKTLTVDEAEAGLKTAAIHLYIAYSFIVMLDAGLYNYSTHEQADLILFQMVLTTVILFSFLIQIERLATTLLIIGVVPQCLLILNQESSITYAMLASIMLLVVGLASAMRVYSREFDDLVQTHTALRKLGEENFRLASVDMITGLPNRREFFHKLGCASKAAKEQEGTFVIGIVDLDGFKCVNDTHGHRVGDLLLTEIARRLHEIGTDRVVFYRLGGDEFAFLVDGPMSRTELEALGARIIATISPPVTIGALITSVGCSVGIAVYPEAATEPDVLYEYCDFALYEAKRCGRMRTEIFLEEHRSRMVEQSAVEHALRSANFEQELYPVFQPITDTRTGKTLAFECLARWNSPKLGLVPPVKFIPAAEQCGLVTVITKVMLRRALAAMHHWPEELYLSFNLSPHDISTLDNVRELLAIIKDSGVAAKRIGFELTETAFIHNFEAARSHLELLKTSGACVALDDFGAGHSSLSRIHALPINKLKVDRRFVMDVETNATSRNIIRSVAGLCKDLGLDCIIEGVETEGQVMALKTLGCDFVQGYYYSRPMPIEDLSGYLARELLQDVREQRGFLSAESSDALSPGASTAVA